MIQDQVGYCGGPLFHVFNISHISWMQYGNQVEISRQCFSVLFILAIKKFGVEARILK